MAAFKAEEVFVENLIKKIDEHDEISDHIPSFGEIAPGVENVGFMIKKLEEAKMISRLSSSELNSEEELYEINYKSSKKAGRRVFFIDKDKSPSAKLKKILTKFFKEKNKSHEPKDFGDFLEQEGYNVSKTIKKMEEEGLIEQTFQTARSVYYRANNTYTGIDFSVDKMFFKDWENQVSTPKKAKEKKIIPSFTMTEKEIDDLAEKAVNAAKEKDIITVFDCLCLPFEEGAGYKEQLFLKIFEKANIEAKYEDSVGVVVPPKGGKREIVVVSHMDLISLFQKGFKKGKKYELRTDDKGRNIIAGALDNTMTNAVAMIVAIHTKQDNVEFVFTEGEETGFWGMKAYMRKFHEKELFYINMDVTNDAWSNHVSVEYDEPNWQICKQIWENLNAGFTTDRVCDDLDVVVDKDGYGFSYCLPTKKTIHSWSNYTLVEKLQPYLEGLFFLTEELDISEKVCNIEHLDLEKAIECKNYEKFCKKEKKAKKKKEKKRKSWSSGSWSRYDDEDIGVVKTVTNYTGSHSGQTYFDFGSGLQKEEEYDGTPQGFGERPPFEVEYTEEHEEDLVTQYDIMNLEYVVKDCIDILQHNNVEVNKYVSRFIHEHTFAQDQWSKDDLAGFIGDMNLAEEVILTLDDNLLLNTIEPGSVYKFPTRSEYSE